MFSTRRCRTTPDGDLVAVSTPNGPVAEFCAALRELQRASGLSRTTLARQLSYGRSQLYEILDGRIKRPPEWDKLVEPLVRACVTGGDRVVVERSVAEWKQRHEVLVRVCEELHRHGVREAGTGGGVLAPRSAAEDLLAHSRRLWPRLSDHPFVRAVSRGELTDAAFRRWMVNDHYFNVEYQRFLAGLAGCAPTAAATEAIAVGIPATFLGLDQVRQTAARFHIELDAEPGPTTVGLAAFLQAQVSRGYEPALAALYATERVYFDAWSGIRGEANRATPYWHLVEHWSSEPYGHWITSLGRMVDVAAPAGATPEMCRAFDRAVRFELLFWRAILDGESW